MADLKLLMSSIPWWAVPVTPLVVVMLLTLLMRGRFSVQADPQRLFDAGQRAEARRRAGGQCEHKPMLWSRCRNKGEQADHIYPWSKGGWTTLDNAQSLCTACNQRKGGKVPSQLYIHRLQRRRRRYFPPDCNPKVRWKPAAPSGAGFRPGHRPT